MSNRHRSVGKYISILYRQGQSYISNEMKEYGIGSGQYAFLLVLYDEDGISQDEISNRLLIDKGTTARALDKLEKEGFVSRVTNPIDRRSNNIFLTDKAKDLEKILCSTLSNWTKLLLKDLNEDEQKLLFETLEKMVYSVAKKI